MESKLIDLGKWAIRSVQMIGYLPISVLKDSRNQSYLEFGPFYRPLILYTLILLFLTFGWELNFFNQLPSYRRYIALFGSTEKTVHFFFVLTASLMGLCFRISGLVLGPHTISFWRDLCQTLDAVQGRLGYFKENILDTSPDFGELKKSLRFSVLTNLTGILLHVVFVYGYRLHHTLTDDTKYWSSDSDFHLGSAFWFTLVLFHVINSIWLSFLIGAVTASFRAVARKIRNLRDDVEFLPRSQEAGDIYSSELFQILKPSLLRGKVESDYHDSSNLLDNLVGNYVAAFVLLEELVVRFNEFFGSQLIAEMFVCISNVVVHSFFMLLWIGRNVWRQVCLACIMYGRFECG